MGAHRAKHWQTTRRPVRRGSAIVSFGLVLPILTVTILGVLDLGMILFKRQHMIQAAREGVRLRAVEGPNSVGPLAQAVTANYLAAKYPELDGKFTITASPQDATTAWVRVQLNHSDGGVVGFISGQNDVRVEMNYLTAAP